MAARRKVSALAMDIEAAATAPIRSYPWPPLLVQFGFVLLRFGGFACCVQAFDLSYSLGWGGWLAGFALAWTAGLVVPDLPLEEAEKLSAIAATHALDLVLLVAPTTPADRMKRIAAASNTVKQKIVVNGSNSSAEFVKFKNTSRNHFLFSLFSWSWKKNRLTLHHSIVAARQGLYSKFWQSLTRITR